MIRELVEMRDFYDAVTEGTGYVVVVDTPTRRSVAHPPYCPGSIKSTFTGPKDEHPAVFGAETIPLARQRGTVLVGFRP